MTGLSPVRLMPCPAHLESLTSEEAEQLKTLIDGGGAPAVYRSLLINSGARLSAADKGIKRMQLEVSLTAAQGMYEGYMVYTDTYCVLIAYSAMNNPRLTLIDVDMTSADEPSYTIRGCDLTILELRSELDDATDDEALAGKADLVGGKVPASQLPSYVDDVVEGYLYDGAFYTDAEHTHEMEAEQGKIYVDLTTEYTYRYSGSMYVQIGGGDSPKKIEVSNITALTSQQCEALNAGDTVVEITANGNVEYTVNLKKEAGEGPAPVANFDGVDYYHKIIVSELDIESGYVGNINMETGEITVVLLGDGQMLPYIMPNTMDKKYYRLISYGNGPVSIDAYLTKGTATAAANISQGSVIVTNETITSNNNALYSEYFTAGYRELDENDNVTFYFNLTQETIDKSKLTLVHTDKDQVKEVAYEDNTYSATNVTNLKELPETLGTAGQVLTVNQAGTGVEWADASSEIPTLIDVSKTTNVSTTIEELYNAYYALFGNYQGEAPHLVTLKFSKAGQFTSTTYIVNAYMTMSLNYGNYDLSLQGGFNLTDMNGSFLFNDATVNTQDGTASVYSLIEGKFNLVPQEKLPNLPNDAASKTYVLKAVNGTFTWVEETSN